MIFNLKDIFLTNTYGLFDRLALSGCIHIQKLSDAISPKSGYKVPSAELEMCYMIANYIRRQAKGVDEIISTRTTCDFLSLLKQTDRDAYSEASSAFESSEPWEYRGTTQALVNVVDMYVKVCPLADTLWKASVDKFSDGNFVFDTLVQMTNELLSADAHMYFPYNPDASPRYRTDRLERIDPAYVYASSVLCVVEHAVLLHMRVAAGRAACCRLGVYHEVAELLMDHVQHVLPLTYAGDLQEDVMERLRAKASLLRQELLNTKGDTGHIDEADCHQITAELLYQAEACTVRLCGIKNVLMRLRKTGRGTSPWCEMRQFAQFAEQDQHTEVMLIIDQMQNMSWEEYAERVLDAKGHFSHFAEDLSCPRPIIPGLPDRFAAWWESRSPAAREIVMEVIDFITQVNTRCSKNPTEGEKTL